MDVDDTKPVPWDQKQFYPDNNKGSKATPENDPELRGKSAQLTLCVSLCTFLSGDKQVGDEYHILLDECRNNMIKQMIEYD